MSARSIEAGEAFVRIGVRDKLTAGLKKAQARMRSFGSGISSMGKMTAGLGAAVAGPLAIMVKRFADSGDQLDKMSKRTGIAVESLSAMKFAAEASGASIDQVASTVQKMNRRFGRVSAGAGTATQVEALEKLGLSVEELSRMNPEERFMAMADAIAGYGDQAAAAGLAQRVLGTGVDALLPMFAGGADGIRELMTEAEGLAAVMSTEDATAAAALTDAMGRVKSTSGALTQQFAAALAPAATMVADLFAQGVRSMTEFVGQNRTLVTVVAGVSLGLIAAGAAMVTVGAAIGVLSFAIGGLITLYGLLTTAATASWVAITGPVGLAVVAIAALGTAVTGVLAYFGAFDRELGIVKSTVGELWQTFTAAFGGIRDAIAGGDLGLAANIAMQGVKLAFAKGLQAIVNLFSATLGNLLGKALSGPIEAAEKELNELLAKSDQMAEKRRREKEQADAARDAQQARIEEAAEAASEAAGGSGEKSPGEQVQDRIQSIREEIMALKLGRDAAERWKLGLAGATAEQLHALEAAQRHKAAIEAQQKASEEARAERERETEDLKRRAEDLNRAMRSPFEVFRDEINELRKLRKFGLDDQAFQKAAAEARQRLEDARGSTNDRMADLSPVGTFSGFAALRGAGDPTQDRIAKAAEETRDAVRIGNRKLDKLGPPKFRR